MKIKWYGHAAFLVTSSRGVRIITDPYDPDAYSEKLTYGRITEQADLVLVSHDHADHNFTGGLSGSPQIIKASSRAEKSKGIRIRAISTFHDPSKGSERGPNTIFTFNVDDIQVCHLGDLGHALSYEEIAEIGRVDVLLIPVGGFYTIDSREATQVSEGIRPKVLIPMHFRTEKCAFPIAPVEDFLKGKPRVKQLEVSETTFDKACLPEQTEIVVLRHAL